MLYKDVNKIMDYFLNEAEEDQNTNDDPLNDIEFDEDDENMDDQEEDLSQEDDSNLDGGNEVEIDVSDLVLKQEELEDKFSQFEKGIQDLKLTFSTFMQKQEKQEAKEKKEVLAKMEQEMQALKDEIKKRNPTPQEKMELQVMNSFPYNTSLSQYWKPDKEGDEYKFSISNPNQKLKDEFNSLNDNTNKNEGDDKSSFYLKMSDVFNDFSVVDVSDSF